MSASCSGVEMEGDILSPVLGGLRAMLRDHFHALKESLLKAIFEGNSDVLRMTSELEAIGRNVCATRELANSLALSSLVAMNTKKALNPVVAAQVSSADLFLKSDIISAVSISSITKYVTTSWPCALVADQVLEILRLLLFAPLAQSRRKARRSDIGRRFVELRIKIIRNMVFNCQVAVRTENMGVLQPLFGSQEKQGGGSEAAGSQATAGVTSVGVPSNLDALRAERAPFRPPAWTAKKFIRRDDIDVAVGELIKQEVLDSAAGPDGVDPVADGGLVQTQAAKKRKPISTAKVTMREEIAREVVKYMWKRWTDWFGASRSEARKSFTLDLGVAFLEPSSRWKPMCSCNSLDEYYCVIETLPATENSSVFRTNYEATSSNIRLFREMLEDYPGFVVTWHYTVKVFAGAADMAENKEGQDFTFRRTVNLLQVAANFLIAYFQVSTLEVFLGGKENSLRFIFILALCFSQVVFRASRPRLDSGSRELVCSEAKELGLLIPSDTGRVHFLIEKCLKMARDTYQRLNMENDNAGGVTSDGDGDSNGGIGDDEDVENIYV